jgi:hypothetical protein
MKGAKQFKGRLPSVLERSFCAAFAHLLETTASLLFFKELSRYGVQGSQFCFYQSSYFHAAPSKTTLFVYESANKDCVAHFF